MAVGYDHTCVIATGGGVKCWGDNRYGQLGIGSYESRNQPSDVTGAARGAGARARVDGHPLEWMGIHLEIFLDENKDENEQANQERR
jgi:hypothetical protein